jgi:hypothetical protein
MALSNASSATITGVENWSPIPSSRPPPADEMTDSFPVPSHITSARLTDVQAPNPALQSLSELHTSAPNVGIAAKALANSFTTMRSNDSSRETSLNGFPRAYDEARKSVLESIITSDNLLPLVLPPSKPGPGRPKILREPAEIGVLPQLREIIPHGIEQIESRTAEDTMSPAVPMKRPRGRPRGSKNKVHAQPTHTESSAPSRGGGVRRGKRRRLNDSNDDEFDMDERSPGISANAAKAGTIADQDLNVTPPTLMTKSGRQVHRPSQFIPLQSPTTAVSHGNSGKKRGRRPHLFGTNTSGLIFTRKTKHSENALCKVCDRGFSPANNAVVFCDGCGDAYHQYCHHPPIEGDVVDQPDKEWLCTKCIRRIKGGFDLHGFVNATDLTIRERRQALDALPREKLVDVLMAVNAVHPDFAIFPSREYLNGTLPAAEEDERMLGMRPEEYYDGYETDPPSHYPRAGCGLARTLPPEEDDLPWLLDDNEDVFNRITYSNEMPKTSLPITEVPVAVDHIRSS